MNWGTLAYGTLEQGANDFVSGFTSALDMLVGDFAQEIWILGGLMFGISDAGTNPITAANNYMQETTRKEAEYFAQNASGSKTAENLNKYGTVVASAIPTLIMAMMTGGTSNAGMAKEGIEKAAAIAKSTDFSRYVAMARSVIEQTAKNPNAQMAFIQGAGHSYEMALEEGASETDAAVLRRKYGSGIIKVANNDVRVGNSQFGLIDLFRAASYNGKGSKLPYKHAGGWDNSVIISEGSQLNKGILKPNCSYVAGENNYIYKTDELGRQCGATACLQLKKHDKRKGNVGKPADKLPGDEAGHLFADMFGGSRFLDNLVAQSFNVNRSEYRKMENIWQRALKDGKSVYADIDLNYEGNSFRPTSFDITYYIDGEYTMLRIYNE